MTFARSERAEAWVTDALARRGRRRTGPPRVVTSWGLSTVLRLPTDEGAVWFKASCEHFRAEAAITRRLAAYFPDLVPVVLASDERAGWLLLEDLSGAGDHDRAGGAVRVLAGRFADAQVAAVDHRAELSADGCPDRGLEATLEGWQCVLDDGAELPLLTAEELAAVRATDVEGQLRSLWACGLPDTLGHGDLHDGNVAWDGRVLRVFDWSDACLTHPFLDVVHLARSSGDPRVADSFADRWRTAYPDAGGPALAGVQARLLRQVVTP